ncbi:hypothetical protein BH09BAC5_BH09BAC5_01010 [soil metagenome]
MFLSSFSFAQSITKNVRSKNGYVHHEYIFPELYSDSLSETKIFNVLDTLTEKRYLVLFGDDTTKFAMVLQFTSNLKEDIFKSNLKEYIFAEYWKNGNNKKTVYYNTQKQKTGKYSELYENQILKITGRYKNDLKTGKWKYYNPDGKLIRIEHYSEGRLVTSKDYTPAKKSYRIILRKAKSGRIYTIE